MSQELFASTAAYYARFRPDYPPALLADLAADCGLDGTGRLLDLGCGTGHLAIGMRRWFAGVVGLDPSEEMLVEAQAQSVAAGVDGITWVAAPAEALTPALGRFRLVTIGRAFHWMRQDEVLRHCRAVLEPGGAVALLGDGGSVWNGTAPWQQATVAVVRRWLGPERRAGGGVFAADETPWADVLARNGFAPRPEHICRVQHVWTVDSITGLLYSSSFCRRDYLGERVAAFEDDLRATLLALAPAGQFTHEIVFTYLLAWPA
jgi:SAM-dependent methyltransferase